MSIFLAFSWFEQGHKTSQLLGCRLAWQVLLHVGGPMPFDLFSVAFMALGQCALLYTPNYLPSFSSKITQSLSSTTVNYFPLYFPKYFALPSPKQINSADSFQFIETSNSIEWVAQTFSWRTQGMELINLLHHSECG